MLGLHVLDEWRVRGERKEEGREHRGDSPLDRKRVIENTLVLVYHGKG